MQQLTPSPQFNEDCHQYGYVPHYSGGSNAEYGAVAVQPS